MSVSLAQKCTREKNNHLTFTTALNSAEEDCNDGVGLNSEFKAFDQKTRTNA